MSMTYPLLYLYRENGYRVGIYLRKISDIPMKRQKLTMRQYYYFRLQQKLNKAHTLHQAGRLFQQFIVDCYMAIEEKKIFWIRNNQTKLRADLYNGLMDAVYRGDSDSKRLGKLIILPSSHTSGPRYRVQNYQYAMAIYR